MWQCICECGSKSTFSTGQLNEISQNHRGCQVCKGKSLMRVSISALWSRLKQGAIKRGYDFEIDREDTFELLTKQVYKYALSGLPIEICTSRKAHMRGGTTASLDRIDNTKGYISGNVWWVHKDVNRMKWVLPLDDFVHLCHLVALTHSNTKGELK